MPSHIVFPNHNPVNGGYADIFLMGPVRNAPPWHEEAVQMLVTMADEVDVSIRIYSPKREGDFESPIPAQCLIPHRMPGWAVREPSPRQRVWELDNLELAAHWGAILCWLPAHGEIRDPNKVYGAISQLELGHWILRAGQDPTVRFAIGTDGAYNGELRTLTCDIKRFAPHLLPLKTSLAELCAQAITWVKSRPV